MKSIFRTVSVVFMLFCLTAGWSSAAPFQNGTFAANFNGWSADVVDYDGNSTHYNDLSSPPGNFSLVPIANQNGMQAQLSSDSSHYIIVLSQVFDFTQGGLMTIAFKYGWYPSDPVPDPTGNVDQFQANIAFWDVSLNDYGTPQSLFALPPVYGVDPPFNVTLTGPTTGTARLDFVLDDSAGNTDTLTIQDVTVTVSAVPEPGTLLLLCAGLPALLLLSRRGTRTKQL